MSEVVLDSSAVLALLLNEPGSDRVRRELPGALLSAVNLAEVVGKLTERGMPASEAQAAVEAIGVEMVEFGIEQACLTGELRIATRPWGLSLGDRACLVLSRLRGAAALTADAAWQSVPGFDVVALR